MGPSAPAGGRILAGFACAPLVGLFLGALSICTFSAISAAKRSASEAAYCPTDDVLFFVLVGATSAYLNAILIGAPTFYAFYRKRWLKWWQIALGGLVVPVPQAFLIAIFDTDFLGTFMRFLALSVPVAVFASLAFWAMAVYRNAL